MLLQQLIEETLSGIKSPEVQKIREIELPYLSYATATGLKIALTWTQQQYIGVIPMTNVACYIGKIVMIGREEGLDERTKTLRRFKIGMHMLITLFKNDKLGYYRGSAENSSRYYLSVKDEEFVDGIIKALGDKNFTPRIYTEPILYSPPLNWGSNKNSEGGDLVRNCLEESVEYNTWENCPDLYRVINKHQRNRYKINLDLLQIAQLSKNDEIIKPTVRRDDYEDENDYKRACKVAESKSRQHQAVLDKANRVFNDPFYAYNFYDNRVGRLYSSIEDLNFGGCKLAKALYRFDTNEKLGTEGLYWLHVHAANCFGYDKASIDDRYRFAVANRDAWIKLAKDAIADKSWQHADIESPWEFLAAIIELDNAYDLDDPTEHPSGLIISWDATCSGLQILAALCRCEKSGKLSNLIPSERRGDYYLAIANKVWKSLDDSEAGKFWKKLYARRRKIAKRPCMTIWYSAGVGTIADALMKDWIGKDGFEGLTVEYCEYLSEMIYDAAVAELPGPASLMRLFQRIGLDAHENREDLQLTTPVTKALWVQNARKGRVEKINIRFSKGDQKKRLQLRVTTERNKFRDIKKVISASAPNIVHMLDSQIVAQLLLDTEYQIACIHDSFGTIPANAGKLYEDTRLAFKKIFKEDQLKRMLQDVDSVDYLTKPFKLGSYFYKVQIGNLDMDTVDDNEWMFS